jgi:hypothetical protein
MAVRIYFKMAANPGTTCGVMQARITAGSAAVEVQVQANGKLRVADNGAASWSAASALSTGTTYRLELLVTAGTTTSNGSMTFAYYAGDSTTPIETTTATTWNTGTTTYEGVRWGKMTSATATWDVWFDDAAYLDGGTALLGPLLGDPVAAATTTNVVELNVGSLTSPVLTQTSGTTATIAGVSGGVIKVTRPAGHTDFLRFTLTHAGGSIPVTIEPDQRDNILVYKGGGAAALSSWKPADPVYNPTRSFVVNVNTAGSNGTLSLTQLSGPAVTITGPTGGVYRVDVPMVSAGEIRLRLTATADGPTPATKDLLLPGRGLSQDLVYTGGGASSIANWR